MFWSHRHKGQALFQHQCNIQESGKRRTNGKPNISFPINATPRNYCLLDMEIRGGTLILEKKKKKKEGYSVCHSKHRICYSISKQSN